ncbi:MAG: LysE family translocator [Pseudomonadota bacterium]
MSTELFTAFAAFAFVSSITPGPNNLMLMASGANFGMRRTIPHALGVSIGFSLMTTLVGVGVFGLLKAYPPILIAMRIIGAGYLLYLAFKIATAAAPVDENDGRASGKPFTFFQAMAFQWVNPKAWTMALTAISLYAPGNAIATIFVIAGVYCVINLPCVSAWALAGVGSRQLLKRQGALRVFNIAMAALLVVTLAPVIIGGNGF